jgi:hypothetical protein
MIFYIIVSRVDGRQLVSHRYDYASLACLDILLFGFGESATFKPIRV